MSQVIEVPDPKREEARGQCRTTETNWAKMPPYIRFRYERALELLPEEGTVYELGCGIGHGVAFLARSRPDLQIVGFDIGKSAIEYGRAHFGGMPNLLLDHVDSVADLAVRLPERSFLIALEVIEHLDDAQLDTFKHAVMEKVDEVVFSFPYDEKNIQGTEHLQSFDIYSIYELFPGFETVFIRRWSLKFIGHWKRKDRSWVRQHLNVAREHEAIRRIANTDGRHDPVPRLLRRLQKLRNQPRAFFRDSNVAVLRPLRHLFRGDD